MLYGVLDVNCSPEGSEMMIGKLLDQRYQVVEVLGQGGFGHTFIAQDTRRPGNPTCVVKLLRPATSDSDFLKTARRLFNSEAETLEKLGNHDQIPRLLAYFEENEEFYLVQEFIDGHPLNMELSPEQRWNEGQVIQLLQEVLSILEFVHNNGVIHRDLKPENLIRRALDQKIVLVDFGAVKQVKMQSLMAQGGVNTLEPIGETVAIGTPGYMPSEQGQGRPRPSSDIYALGMIGIQALTGLNPRQLSEDVETGEIIWRQLAEVSDGVAGVLNKMVRPYFKHRYQSATEALQALESVSNPYAPLALAANLGQKVRNYWTNGYHSVSTTVRSLQEKAQSYIQSNSATAAQPKLLPANPTLPLAPGTQKTVTIHPGTLSNAVDWPALQEAITQFPHKVPVLMGVGTATLAIAFIVSAIRQPAPPPTATQTQAEITPASPKPESPTPQPSASATPKAESPTPQPSASATPKAESPIPQPSASATPKPESPTPQPSASATPKPDSTKNCFVVIKSSNIRSSPRGKTLEVLESGTKITVTGKQENGWIEVSEPVKGWVWKTRTKNTCPPDKKASDIKKN